MMGHALSSPPPQHRSRRVSLAGQWRIDARTFVVSISRQQWSEISFEFLLDDIVVMDGPSLVYPDRRWLRAVELQGLLAYARYLYRRERDPDAKEHFAKDVRKHHVALVNLAIGYTWPGNPPGHIEFAPDV